MLLTGKRFSGRQPKASECKAFSRLWFFYREREDRGKISHFCVLATLGRQAYLHDRYFAEDYFDYIVIDEFHHAVTEQYKRIMAYFKPKFLLGLTATPERMTEEVFMNCVIIMYPIR